MENAVGVIENVICKRHEARHSQAQDQHARIVSGFAVQSQMVWWGAVLNMVYI